jgi:hypothetical protein
LNKICEKYPKLDPEYEEKKESSYLHGVINNRLPQLETQRQKMLSKDYAPRNDWWESMITED